MPMVFVNVGKPRAESKEPTFTGELKNAVPRGLGQTVQGIGQVAEDLGWEDNPIKAYGQRVIDRNPTQINSLEDIAEHPAAAFGSAIGNAASFLGPGLGLKGLMALRGVGTAGQFAAQAGLAGLPSYGGIREEQIAGGNNSPIDMLAAGAGAVTVGAIENLGGAQRMLGMGLGRTGQRAAIEEFGKTPWRTVGKTMGRGALEEGAEELVQNPIEQMAAYRDPRTEGAIDETLFGGAMGALGGLGFGGGIGAYRGLQHRALRNDLREHGYIDPQGGTPTDLLAGLENRDYQNYLAPIHAEAVQFDQMRGDPAAFLPEGARSVRGLTADDVNANLGVHDITKQEHARRQNEYNKMFGAGSGVFVVDPQTQQERELTLGEWHQISNLEVPRQQNTSGLNLPALRTPAEAVALLDFAHNEQQRGHPVAEGTELHQRVLEADAMLRGMGIVYRGQDRVNPNIKTPIAEAQWLRTGQQEEAKKEEPKPVVPSKTTTNLLSSLSEHLAAKTITQGEYDTAVSQLTVAEAKVHDAPKGTKQAIRKSILAPVHKSVGEMLQSKVKGAKNANGQSVRTGSANEAGQGQNLPGGKTQGAGATEVQGGGAVQAAQGEVNGAQTAEATVPAVQEKARQGNAVQAGFAKVVQALTPAQREYFAVAEEVAGTGVADHDAEIARKLGVTRQAVLDRKKRALAAILKKIKSEYGLDEEQAREVLKAHFASKRVTEMADEAALGMEPGRQAQKVGTEEVFGDSERGGKQQMSIVDSAGKTTEDPFGDMTGNAGNVEGTKLLEAAGAIGDGGLTKTETSDATPGEKQKAAAEQEKAARKAQEQLIEQLVATDPNYQFAVNDFNEFKPEGVPEFSALASVDKLDYIEWWIENRDAIFEATNGQLDRIFGGYFGNINYKAVGGAPKENRSVAQDTVKRIESKDSGNAAEAARNPVEQRVDALKAKLGEKQQKGVDRLIARYQKGEIDLGRLNDELDNYDGQLEEGIKFSKSSTPDNPTNAQLIKAALKGWFFSGTRMDQKVTVVDSVEDLPADVKKRVSSDKHGPTVTQAFVDTDGRVYMVAGNIESGQELAVFLHEVGVHLGMEKLLGKENYDRLKSQISKWHGAKGLEGDIARRAMDRAMDADEAAVKRGEEEMAPSEFGDELLAYFVEEAVNAGVDPSALHKTTGPLRQWFRTLYAALKAALRKFGFDRLDQLTAKDVVNLAYGAARLEIEGTWHGTASAHRKFDHRYMGTGEGAQAYGWGTYLAQRSGIAYEYWKADVGRKATNSVHLKDYPRFDELWAASLADDHLGFDKLNEVTGAARKDGMAAMKRNFPDMSKALETELNDYLKWRLTTRVKPEGSLMRVDTAVHDDEMLDWDKPLSEQSDLVKEALYKTGVLSQVAWEVKPRPENDPNGFKYGFFTIPNGGRFRVEELPNGNYMVKAMFGGMAERGYSKDGFDREFLGNNTQTGAALYHKLTGEKGSDKAASEYLDSIGIKGIKFLDSQSRNASKSIDNYPGKMSFESTLEDDDFLGFDSFKQMVRALITDTMVEGGGRKHLDGYQMSDGSRREINSFLDWYDSELPQTHNLVIFNDKNIQRVATQIGASRESKNIRYSERKADNSIPAFTNDFSKNWWQYTKDMAEDWYNRGLMAAVFSHDLEKIAVKAGLTKATGFFELGHQKEAIRNRLETAAEAILAQSDKLTDRAEAESFLRDSTVDGKWGFAPEWDKTAVVDPTYAKRFKALTPEAQKVVKEVFKHGEDTYTAIRTELAAEIAQEYDSLIEKEKDPTAKAQLIKDKEKATRMQARLLPKRNGPYAPLRRFGDYVFIGKSKEYAEAEKNKDTTRMNALIADPEKIHYLVEFYDNIAQAKARERQIGSRFHQSIASVKQKEFYDVDTVPWAGVQRLKSAISDAKDTKYKAAMQRIVTELYLQSVAETSARKAELSRKGTKERSGVAGSDDMFRGFAANAMASAHYVASLSKNKEVVKQISEMKAEAHDKSNGDERHEATRALNEVMARYAQGLNYRPTPVVDKMLRVSSVWMLMTSPAYYLQNSMQPFMFSAPYMAGRKGVGIDGAFSALTTAYKQTAKFVKNMGAELDIESMPISAAEKKMLHEMWNNGKLDIGINAELGRWKNASGKDPIPILSTTMRRLDKAMLQVETLNRVTTALAAYRVSNGDSKYVAEVLDNTHGNYAKSNAPRFFHANGLTKLTMQFKKYQLIQMSLLVRMAHKAFAGASAEEKSVGRAALLWLLGQHLAVTGLAGTVPVALLMAAGAIGGDDDKDWERNLRKYIGDDKVSDLLLHGVPAALGLDVSKKLGISNAFSLLPFTDVPTDKSGYEKAIVSLSGAFIGGLGSRTFDAIGQMGKGNYYKGVEQLLPRGPSDAMKAYRFYTEGVTNRRNDTLLKPDDITLVDAMMQGVGLPSTTITNFQRQRGDVFELSKHFKEKDQSLSDQYNAAKKAGDTEEMADLRQEYMEVQQSKKRWIEELRRQGFTSKEMAKELQPHPLSTLMKGASNQMKREAKWGHSAAA